MVVARLWDDDRMNAVEQIGGDAGRIVDLARSSDLATPVPWLGRWKVRDVVAHLGGVHRWADRIVQARSMDGPSFTKSKLDGAELVDWFEEGAAALVDTLASTPPDEPCPNFNPGSDKTVGWWGVRQLNETTLHRWDVEAALGAPGPIDAVVAATCVGEYLDTFVRTRGKQTATGPFSIVTTDEPTAWSVTLAAKPGRVDIAAGATEAAPTLSGSAAEVLLVLWGRRPLDAADVEILGDRAPIRAFLGLD